MKRKRYSTKRTKAVRRPADRSAKRLKQRRDPHDGDPAMSQIPLLPDPPEEANGIARAAWKRADLWQMRAYALARELEKLGFDYGPIMRMEYDQLMARIRRPDASDGEK